jgi:hypothetical protein
MRFGTDVASLGHWPGVVAAERSASGGTLVERHGDEWRERSLEPVVFVPLIGAHGYDEGRTD